MLLHDSNVYQGRDSQNLAGQIPDLKATKSKKDNKNRKTNKNDNTEDEPIDYKLQASAMLNEFY